MINEQKLYDFLARLYEVLQAQHESFYHVQSATVALVEAVKETHPEMIAAYERHHQQFVEENAGRYDALQTLFHQLIQNLRAGKI